MFRRITSLILSGVLLLFLVPTAAIAQTQSISPACPSSQLPPADFWDVSGTHATAIECLSWWDVTQGNTLTTYNPGANVTRGQMATFVVRTIEAIGGELPDASGSPFEDISGHPHQQNIERLAAANIVSGVTTTRYEPGRNVPRGQMATFLVRAFEHAAGSTLTAGENPFGDIDGHAHEERIVKAVTAGFTSGTTANTFSPNVPVDRAQMGSFLARLLAAGVEQFDADLPGPSSARIAGSGNDVVRGRIVNDMPALVQLEHDGDANFIIWALDANNERTSLLVNVIGEYSGMTSVHFGSFSQPVHAFEVQADGAWSMRLLPLSAARSLSGSGDSGTGDEIVDVSALVGSDLRMTHDGSANFVVWAHDSDGREISLVVNTIGEFDGVQILHSDTRWLRIRADGNWTAEPN